MTDSPDKKGKAGQLASGFAIPSDGIPPESEFFPDSSRITAVRSMPDEVMRGETTPAPLPPSPATKDQDEWLDRRSTDSSVIPDLGAMAGGTDSGAIPVWAVRAVTHSETALPAAKPEDEAGHKRPWYLPVLLYATCIAVGMVLGALLQSRLAAPNGPAPDCSACECPADTTTGEPP